MAILTVVQQPPRFQSAYKPLLVGVTSARSPINTMAGESGDIVTLHAATATDVSTYGGQVELGEMLLVHGTIVPILQVGQAVRIDTYPYNSVFRILKSLSSTAMVIEAEDLGELTTGRVSKHYENYKLIAEVTMENYLSGATPIRFDIEPDPEDDVFYLNVSEAATVNFADVFEIAEGGQPIEFISANRYITQQWSVNFSEAYMIPDANGVNVYTEMGKDGATTSVTNKVAVNSVQPYHHIDELTGDPDHQWMDDLDDYLVDNDVGDRRRFLTYAPRGGTVTTYDGRNSLRLSDTDDFWLGILSNDGGGTLNLRIVFYGEDNLQDQMEDINFTGLDGDSFIFNIGPVALAAYIVPTTHHYSVRFHNTLTGDYSEVFWVTLDNDCMAERRFVYLNSFGALDQYTVANKEGRENTVDSRVVTKPNMAINLNTTRGDYQRRTASIDLTRRFYASTRTESKAVARYLADELLASPDVRTVIYDNGLDGTVYTRVILETDKAKLNHKGARIDFVWSYGVDNVKQRR